MKQQYIFGRLSKISINIEIDKKFNYYLFGLLILSFIFIHQVFAQEEVGRCYPYAKNIVIDPKTNEVKDTTHHTRGSCIFAWRLKFDEDNEGAKKTLITTAGAPANNKNIRSFLTDDKYNDELIQARLTRAHGPLHNGKTTDPEWDIEQTKVLKDYSEIEQQNSRLDTLWTIAAYGLELKNEPYINRSVLCQSKIVDDDDEEAVKYADGCFTYNYNETGPDRMGYFGMAGISNGGPIQPRSFGPSGSTTPVGTPACSDIKPKLVNGETCDDQNEKVVIHMDEGNGNKN